MTEKEKAIRAVEAMAEKLFADPVIYEADPQVFSGAVNTLKAKGRNVGLKLLERAINGNKDADWVLRYEAANLLMGGQPLAQPLAIYIAGILFDSLYRRSRGRGDPYRNAKRDLFIIETVKRLQAAGINPTRNKSLHNTDATDSGCSLAKKFLAQYKIDVAESTVETVWTNHLAVAN
jgi:hypothetical protein